MPHIFGADHSEVLLFPEALDDYITDNNPVRFIDTFVVSLDLAALGFARTAAAATGRPAYSPADLLRLYIYGYLNRVRSSRLLEREARRRRRSHVADGQAHAGLQDHRRFSQRQPFCAQERVPRVYFAL